MLSFKYASSHTVVTPSTKGLGPAPPAPASQPRFAGTAHAAAAADHQKDAHDNSKEVPDYLDNTAIVTMATGDDAARLAVALVQSLRDVKTRVPHIVVLLSKGGLGSADCKDDNWKRAHGRERVPCDGNDVIAEEIISERYVKALQKLGAEIEIIEPIPDTPFTVIPGGRQIFWGMAFNKLRVFGMTRFRKLIWMDSDTIALRNFDFVMREPMFTAAFTYDCCNANSPAKPSGGFWIVEPGAKVYARLMKLISGPVPGTNDPWHWGDMQVVRYLFGAPPPATASEPYWPTVNDHRHGYVKGLHYFPEIAQMNDLQFRAYLEERLRPDIPRIEGFVNSTWDGKRPPYVWRMLDARFDQCVGMCECIPGRDMPRTALTMHFSCMRHVEKPAKYETEKDFMHAMYYHALSCTRYYYMVWYEKFQKAMGRLPPPYWTGPAIPLYNSTHDEIVRAQRLVDKV